ncbi:MAG TPA: molecular chaperone DnaK, partial [Erythrobacter sp.]|nr:molecular chaperone DnaK [Erythrobacter sp.]
LVHATEKQLEEHGDKIDASLKSEVEEKVAALKTALEGDDPADINAKAEDLSQSAMKMGQSIYEQEQANAASAAPEGEAASDGGAEEEVVDAEFSEVDEDAKN